MDGGVNLLTHKRCTLCRKPKVVAEFSNHRTNPDRLQYRCKECSNKLSAEWRAKKKAEREAAAQGLLQQQPEGEAVSVHLERSGYELKMVNVPTGGTKTVARLYCAGCGVQIDLGIGGKRRAPPEEYINQIAQAAAWEF